MICESPGCGGAKYAKGLCRSHYLKSRYVPRTETTSEWHRISDVDEEARTGVCSKCGPVVVGYKASKDYWECSTQAKNRRKGKSRSNSETIQRRKRAVTELPPFDGLCEICDKEMEIPCIDHNHDTGELRGYLCRTCNAGIGMLKDDPEVLQRAIEYLSRGSRTPKAEAH